MYLCLKKTAARATLLVCLMQTLQGPDALKKAQPINPLVTYQNGKAT